MNVFPSVVVVIVVVVTAAALDVIFAVHVAIILVRDSCCKLSSRISPKWRHLLVHAFFLQLDQKFFKCKNETA